MFAINGSLVVVGSVDADAPALSNYTQPSWLAGKLPPSPTGTEGRVGVLVTISPVASKQNARPNPFTQADVQPQNIPAARIAAE